MTDDGIGDDGVVGVSPDDLVDRVVTVTVDRPDARNALNHMDAGIEYETKAFVVTLPIEDKDGDVDAFLEDRDRGFTGR